MEQREISWKRLVEMMSPKIVNNNDLKNNGRRRTLLLIPIAVVTYSLLYGSKYQEGCICYCRDYFVQNSLEKSKGKKHCLNEPIRKHNDLSVC